MKHQELPQKVFNKISKAILEQESYSALKKLLKKTNKDQINQLYEYSNDQAFYKAEVTLLSFALMSANREAVRLLLEKGMNPHLACENQYNSATYFLIAWFTFSIEYNSYLNQKQSNLSNNEILNKGKSLIETKEHFLEILILLKAHSVDFEVLYSIIEQVNNAKIVPYSFVNNPEPFIMHLQIHPYFPMLQSAIEEYEKLDQKAEEKLSKWRNVAKIEEQFKLSQELLKIKEEFISLYGKKLWQSLIVQNPKIPRKNGASKVEITRAQMCLSATLGFNYCDHNSNNILHYLANKTKYSTDAICVLLKYYLSVQKEFKSNNSSLNLFEVVNDIGLTPLSLAAIINNSSFIKAYNTIYPNLIDHAALDYAIASSLLTGTNDALKVFQEDQNYSKEIYQRPIAKINKKRLNAITNGNQYINEPLLSLRLKDSTKLLNMSITNLRPDLVEQYLLQGADPNMIDDHGKSSIIYFTEKIFDYHYNIKKHGIGVEQRQIEDVPFNDIMSILLIYNMKYAFINELMSLHEDIQSCNYSINTLPLIVKVHPLSCILKEVVLSLAKMSNGLYQYLKLLEESKINLNVDTKEKIYNLRPFLSKFTLESWNKIDHQQLSKNFATQDEKKPNIRIANFIHSKIPLAINIDGNTLAHLTICHPTLKDDAKVAVLDYLYNNGINLHTKNNEGITPAKLAVEKKNGKVLELLLQYNDTPLPEILNPNITPYRKVQIALDDIVGFNNHLEKFNNTKIFLENVNIFCETVILQSKIKLRHSLDIPALEFALRQAFSNRGKDLEMLKIFAKHKSYSCIMFMYEKTSTFMIETVKREEIEKLKVLLKIEGQLFPMPKYLIEPSDLSEELKIEDEKLRHQALNNKQKQEREKYQQVKRDFMCSLDLKAVFLIVEKSFKTGKVLAPLKIFEKDERYTQAVWEIVIDYSMRDDLDNKLINFIIADLNGSLTK